MSRASDVSGEMPGELPVDDVPAPFAEEVRFAVSGPPPVPSPALAAVLKVGLSEPHDKGDLLVTAASNVHGPALQVAGLPNWEKENRMGFHGFLASTLAKLGGASGAAKAALAGVAAVTTMGLAGGAAGVLPGPAQTLVASAVNAATPFTFPDAGNVTDAVQQAVGTLSAAGLPTGVTTPSVPPASVTASARAGSTGASTTASASTGSSLPAVTPSIPNVSVPGLPSVSIAPAVVGNLPACVKNLIPTAGAAPDPTNLAAQIQACIPQVLSTANLPPQVASCVSSILATIGGASGMNTSSLPSVGSLSMSSCVPMDASPCLNSMMTFLANLKSLSGGSLPTAGSLSSLPGFSSLAGCVPMDVSKCLTSITSALSTGALSGGSVPKLDLSACVPTGLPTGSLPGMGSLSNLPGISGALPFFTK